MVREAQNIELYRDLRTTPANEVRGSDFVNRWSNVKHVCIVNLESKLVIQNCSFILLKKYFLNLIQKLLKQLVSICYFHKHIKEK